METGDDRRRSEGGSSRAELTREAGLPLPLVDAAEAPVPPGPERLVLRELDLQREPVGVPSSSAAVMSDRYAIRTRNLQDWNLTRYRCANRSKASTKDAAAVLAELRLALLGPRVRRDDWIFLDGPERAHGDARAVALLRAGPYLNLAHRHSPKST